MKTIRAPLPASSSAATSPMPDVAPVITTVLPCMIAPRVNYPGRSCHRGLRLQGAIDIVCRRHISIDFLESRGDRGNFIVVRRQMADRIGVARVASQRHRLAAAAAVILMFTRARPTRFDHPVVTP